MNADAFVDSIDALVESTVQLRVVEIRRQMDDDFERRFTERMAQHEQAMIEKVLASIVIPSGPPGPDGKQGDKGDPGESIVGPAGRDGLDGKDGMNGKDGVGISAVNLKEGRLVLSMTDGTEKDVGFVVGPRGADGIAGPEGQKGMDGSAGKDARDGRDGIGLPELKAAVDHAVGETFKSLRFDGERVLTLAGHTLNLPATIYRGMWKPEESYVCGDMVTYAGCVWCCKESTNEKPETSEAWQLAVKSGRNGRDRFVSDGKISSVKK